MKKKYAKMCFKAEIKDTDTDDTIVERMFNEIESYLDVIGIRRDLIEIVEEDEPEPESSHDCIEESRW